MPLMTPQEQGPFGGDPGSTLQSVQQPPPGLPLEQQQSQQSDPLDQIKQSLAQRYQKLQPTPASGGPIRQLLQNFFSGGGEALGHSLGMPTRQEQQQQTLDNLEKVSNVQGMDQFRKAQASQYEMVDVPLPDGTTGQLPKKFMGAWLAATTKTATGDAANASREKIAGMNNDTKLDIAGQANATKLDQFKQTLAYKQWKEKLDIGTKMRVAQMNMGKAPAAMMQTATFAKSGLDLLDDARTAFNDLKNRGVLGDVSSDKMENWIFGKGLIDPSVSPADRQKISKLRAALSYTSSAAMRAHTGRTSQEIYNDFKGTLGLGQGSDALEGAMDETQKMLGTYAVSASDAAIQNLRNAAGVKPQTAQPSHRFNPATGKIEAIK